MTQNEMILKYLQDYGSITPLDAIREFGCLRLSARIADLRARGYEIETEIQTSKNRYGHSVGFARYRLNTENEMTKEVI